GTYGRDDERVPAEELESAGLPQWSPALTAGMTGAGRPTGSGTGLSPQWSPALTAGMTRSGRRSSLRRTRGPQWSPALTAGMTQRSGAGSSPPVAPQWSPALTAGMTPLRV